MQQASTKASAAHARKAVLAETAVLESVGLQLLSHSDAEGTAAEYKGWRFKTTHGPIMHEGQLAELSADISSRIPMSSAGDDSIVMNNVNMHFPEMVFGQDKLSITHLASGLEISFNANDCLFLWANAHLSEVEVVKVPQAWNRTQSTDNLQVMEYDWTFTTDYCFTVQRRDSQQQVVGAVQFDEETASSACVERVETSGINVELLKAREPILFYDEVSLFQDDLHDHGEVAVDVKVRVMPGCWFVLQRFFLRVDGCCVKIRETRVFHEFDTDNIHVDVSYRDVNAATLVELAIPSVAMRDVNIMTQRLPVDNSRLKLPSSFRIPINVTSQPTS